MSDRVYVDTGVLLAAFQGQDERARERAWSLLGSHTPVVGVLAMLEFFAALTGKSAEPQDEELAERAVECLARLPSVQMDAVLVRAAVRRARQLRISIWNAIAVESAIQGGCVRLVTEELGDGLSIDGLRIESPFSDVAPSSEE